MNGCSVSAVPVAISVEPAAADAITFQGERKYKRKPDADQDLPRVISDGDCKIRKKLHDTPVPRN